MARPRHWMTLVLLGAGAVLIGAVAARGRLRSRARVEVEQPQESPPNPVPAASAPSAAPQAEPRAIQSQADFDAVLRQIRRDLRAPIGALPETGIGDDAGGGGGGDSAFFMILGAVLCGTLILGTGYLTSYLLSSLDLTWPWLALWVLLAMTVPAIVVLLLLVPRTRDLNDAAGVRLFGIEMLRVLALLLMGAFFAWLFRGEVHPFIASVVALQMLNLSDRIYLYVHETLWWPRSLVP